MKACLTSCLILMLLSLTPRACGGSGPEPTLVASTQEQAQKLARRHLDAGVALHESGRFADAVPEYDLALRLYPHYDEAYMNRGMVYAQLDENQRAIQDFEQAVRLNPNLPGVYAGWGRALMAMGEPEEAIRNFHEAILLDPLDTESYLDRGDAYSDMGRDARTLNDYNEAVEIEPDKAEAYYQRGFDRTGLAEFELALERLQ